MAKLSIKSSSFKDKLTGETINYDRLVIDGYLLGKRYVAEFKIEGKNDIMLAQLLLNSDENAPEVHNVKIDGAKPIVTVETDSDFEEKMDDFFAGN